MTMRSRPPDGSARPDRPVRRPRRHPAAVLRVLLLLALLVLAAALPAKAAPPPDWVRPGTALEYRVAVYPENGTGFIDWDRQLVEDHLWFNLTEVGVDDVVVEVEGPHWLFAEGTYTINPSTRRVLEAPDPIVHDMAFPLWGPPHDELVDGDLVPFYNVEFVVHQRTSFGNESVLAWGGTFTSDNGTTHDASMLLKLRISRDEIYNSPPRSVSEHHLSVEGDRVWFFNLERVRIPRTAGELPDTVVPGAVLQYWVTIKDDDGGYLGEDVVRYRIEEVSATQVAYTLSAEISVLPPEVQGRYVVDRATRRILAAPDPALVGTATDLWVSEVDRGDRVEIGGREFIVTHRFESLGTVSGFLSSRHTDVVDGGEVAVSTLRTYDLNTGLLSSWNDIYHGHRNVDATLDETEVVAEETGVPGWIEPGTVLTFTEERLDLATREAVTFTHRYEVLSVGPQAIEVAYGTDAPHARPGTFRVDPGTRAALQAPDPGDGDDRIDLWAPAVAEDERVRIGDAFYIGTGDFIEDDRFTYEIEGIEVDGTDRVFTFLAYDASDRVLVRRTTTNRDLERTTVPPGTFESNVHLEIFFVPSRESDLRADVLAPLMIGAMVATTAATRRRRRGDRLRGRGRGPPAVGATLRRTAASDLLAATVGAAADVLRGTGAARACPACGAAASAIARTCPGCGTSLKPWPKWLVPARQALTAGAVGAWLLYVLGPAEVVLVVHVLSLALPPAALTLHGLTRTGPRYTESGFAMAATIWTASLVFLVAAAVHGFESALFGLVDPVLDTLVIVPLGAALGATVAFLAAPGPADPWTDRAVLVTFVGGPVVWFAMFAIVETTDFLVLFAVAAAAASLLWTLVGPWLARATVVRALRRTGGRLVRVAEGPVTAPSAGSRTILAFAAVPLLFAYAVAAWADVFTTSAEGLDRALLIGRAAFILLGTLAVFIVPAKWLFDRLDLRTYDASTGEAHPIGVPARLEDLVGIGAILGLLATSFGGGGAVTRTGVIGGFASAVLTIWFLLPAALVPTYLYVRFRMAGDLARLSEEVPHDQVAHLLDLEVPGDPTTPSDEA